MTINLPGVLSRPSFDAERVIHSLKTAFACLLGFVVTSMATFHMGQWLIITIIVVMCGQLNVGSVLQKSYMRFLGTLAGSLLAILTITLFGTDLYVSALSVALSALIFSYIATSKKSYNDAGTLGAVTTTIILVGQNPTVMVASERFLEISVGILIAAFISQFILPVHARIHLKRTQALTFRQLRSYYLASLLTDQSEEHPENYHALDEAIVSSFLTQRKLAVDAAREPLRQGFTLGNFEQLLLCEKEILRCTAFMHYSYKESPETKKIFSTMSLLYDFHDPICQILENIALSLEKKTMTKLMISLPTARPIKEAIKTSEKHLEQKDMVCANAFLFCAEIMLNRLEQAILLMNKINAKTIVIADQED